MNALPESRRAIHGRTWGRSWSAADFDPIERYRVTRTERIAGVMLAVALGIVAAALLAHWAAS